MEPRWGKKGERKLEPLGNTQVCSLLKITSVSIWKIVSLTFLNDFNFMPFIKCPSWPQAEYKIYSLFSDPF